MAALDAWLKQATRYLSKDSTARVRAEILQHYEAARDAALIATGNAADAERLAMAALGDAKTVNCQYRQVLLTSVEARVLGDGNWEAKAVCSRPWFKHLVTAIPIACLLASTASFLTGSTAVARLLLAAAIGAGPSFAAPFLPVYTPSRARNFRRAKWLLMAMALLLAFGPDALKLSWLLSSCLWPIFWVEWTRVSIRRKLRVADWPKHLYL